MTHSDELYALVADLITDYVYVLRVLPDGEVAREWSNDAVTRVTGYRSEEIDAPGAWQRLIHPDDLTRAFEHVVRLIAGERHVAEYRVATRDGRHRWLRDTGQPLRDSADGPIVRIVGAAQDITAAKQHEERLRFLAEAGVALDSSLDYATTLDRVARMAVPTLADWCQVDLIEEPATLRTVATAHVDPEREQLAIELRRLYPPNPANPASVWEVYRTGRPTLVSATEELSRAQARDAEHARLLARMGTRSFLRVPLAARGTTFGVLSFGSMTPAAFAPEDVPLFEDLARRAALAVDNARLYGAAIREIAERRAADEAHRELVTMIGHELRNPLASLRGYAQLLQRRRAYEESALSVMVEQVDRLDRLIGDVLDAARLERGHVELSRAPSDIIGIANAAAASAQALSDGYVVLVEASTPMPWGDWDHHRLGQVLQNLISNAIKYSPPGQIVVRVDDVGDSARVSVVDRGPGIADIDQSRLFQRSSRSDAPRMHDSVGLGLGLYICRRLIEQHGGSIWAEQTPGGGATFTFTLPYVRTS